MAASKVRALLVDDDDDLREAMRETLAAEGYEIDEASDGQAALDYLASHPTPPVILLDWNMAPMNGPQFMHELSKDAALSKIPVILLTADAKAPEKSGRHDFVGYLTKPFKLDMLLQMLAPYGD